MCEVMERYQAAAVNEATIKTALRFNASESDIVDLLMSECNLTEVQAKDELKKYLATNTPLKTPLHRSKGR